MNENACPRLFEAEALRDGRLSGSERTSFERHVAVCSVCAGELAALDALANALREEPAQRSDELHVRRERTRLLAAFDRELVRSERPAPNRYRLIWLAAVVALIAAAVVVWSARRATKPVAALEASRAIIHAGSATAWSERLEQRREMVRLEHGALWIHVEHRSGLRRLLVLLPDGELEDTGTTFTVSAENGRTTRVAVRQGSVVLRLRGQPPVALGPGETWTPRAAAPACLSSRPNAAPAR